MSLPTILLVSGVTMIVLVPGILAGPSLLPLTLSSTSPLVSKITQQIEIAPGSDFYIKFDAQNLSFNEEPISPFSSGLSEHIVTAIAKAPVWIQQDLTRQFQSLASPEPYAELLLNASRRYADEIAFCIACTPLGHPPSVELIHDNVFSLYEHDRWIQYADIKDYDAGNGDYFSTIRYKVLEDSQETYIELPKEIYYWYVVHPKIAGETISFIYDSFWRSYMTDHNDLGYPLLKEKLSTIQYLWDCQSYSQPGNRLWTQCIQEHPTAIEAVSYWIGKTVPYNAMGDRPGDPNVIAHEHNGWCGELQRIAVAAQRAALIPSIGACNVGEDHVWREFYEREWHENDNWWTDSGGAVDQPDVYAYGWGKNMSAIYAWKGDDTIYDVTPTYIHPEDRITVTFDVKDSYLQSLDGARVIVLVNGLKDITWYKNFIWEKIQSVWDRLPEFLKGRILQGLFDKLQEKFEGIPDVINGATITTWNYTDINGLCTFELGKNLEYTFLIQQGNLKKPWQLARHTTLRTLKTHEEKTFHIIFPTLAGRVQPHTNKRLPSGDCVFDLSFTSAAVQFQQNFRTDTIGIYRADSSIDVFIVDQQNFQKYLEGKRFACSDYTESETADIRVSTTLEDWYVVFRNHARHTSVIVDFSLQAQVPTSQSTVQIVAPSTTLFEFPMYIIGDTILFEGVASQNVQITIDTIIYELTPVNSEWSYVWDTTGHLPGEYLIIVTCGNVTDEQPIRLIDGFAPDITILSPGPDTITEDISLYIYGSCNDDAEVGSVSVAVDDSEWRTAEGTEQWSIIWNISELSLGDHTLLVKAVDTSGLSTLHIRSFVKNETGHNWGPTITSVFYLPVQPTNTSNVIIYANVTTGISFALKNVILLYDNGTGITEQKMYRYGDFPIQDRHEEDPLNNQSNAPLYGLELGQLPSGTTITYWITAYDTANNVQLSDEYSFTVN